MKIKIKENAIVEISDASFGDVNLKMENPLTRIGARGIVKRQDGRIAVINKVNKNEFKLPVVG